MRYSGEADTVTEMEALKLTETMSGPHQDVYVAEQEKSLTPEQLWDELAKLEEAEKQALEIGNVWACCHRHLIVLVPRSRTCTMYDEICCGMERHA